MSKEKDLKLLKNSKKQLIERGNDHFGDIKRALQRSSNDKEG